MTERSVSVRLRAEVAGYIAGMRSAATATRSVATEAQKAALSNRKASQDIGRAALIAGAALTGIGVAAVKTFADFDQAMSGVRAATHETASNMQLLRAAALKAGADTAFSATEAANGMEELAKAGVSTKDIIGGGLGGALSLAAAGQLSVAESAEIAASAMTQFGKSGAEVPHIADLLAAGAGKAQGSVHDMGLALSYVGPVAAQMGVSIEETSGAIALLASNGILGEKAGTNLRGVLASLTAPSVKAAETMKQFGIQVYDAQGKFIGFRGVADQLQTSLGGLDEKTRNQALGQIFGNQQLVGALTLYKSGASAVDAWTKKVNDSGYAQETAAIKLDNLRGDMEKFSGSLQTALINSGTGANDALRGITQTATGAVNQFSELPGPVQEGATAFTALGGASLLAVGAFGTMAPKVRETRTALMEMGSAGQFANKGLGALGKAGVWGAAITVLGVAVQAASDELTKLEGKAAPSVDALTASLVKFNETGRITGAAMQGIGGDSSKLVDDLDKLNDLGADTSLFFNKTSFGTFARDLDQARDRVDAIDKSLAGLVTSGHGDVAKEIFKQLADQVRAGGRSVDEFRSKLNDYATANTNASTAAKLNADSTGDLGGEMGDIAATAEDAASAIDDYKGSLDALNGVNIDARRAQIALRQAFVDTRKAIDGSSSVTDKERSALLDLASQANDTAKAVVDQTGSQEQANGVIERARRRFINLAEQMGYSAKQARHFANEVLGIPPKIAPTFSTPGLDKALAGIIELRRQAGIPISVTVTTINHLRNIPADGGVGRAGGGMIYGPGTATSDSVPAMLSKGEYVVKAAAVAKYGPYFFERANSMRLAGGGGPVGHGALATAAGVAAIVGSAPARDSLADIDRAIAAVQKLTQAYSDQQAMADMNAKQRRRYMAEQQTAADTDILDARRTIAANREQYQFDHLAADQQIKDINKRLANERKYSDEWMALQDQKKTIIEEQAALEEAAAKAAAEHATMLANNQQAWAFDHMSAQQQIADLDARIAAEEMYSDQWLADQRQREQIVNQEAAAEQAAADARVKAAMDDIANARAVRDEYAKTIASSITAFGALSAAQAGAVDDAKVAALTDALRQAQKFGTTADVVAAKAALDTANKGEPLTGKSITDTSTNRLAQARTFVANMRALKAAGLNDASLKEILGMGPEGGGAYAQALLDGGLATITLENANQADLASLGQAFGAESAGWFHQAGVDSAQGFYDGMLANDPAARAAAQRFADNIVSEVRSSLEIASPSKRMAREVGIHLPAGVMAGAKQGAPAMNAYLRDMVQLQGPTRYADQRMLGAPAPGRGWSQGGLTIEHHLHAAPSVPSELQLAQMTARSMALLNL